MVPVLSCGSIVSVVIVKCFFNLIPGVGDKSLGCAGDVGSICMCRVKIPTEAAVFTLHFMPLEKAQIYSPCYE